MSTNKDELNNITWRSQLGQERWVLNMLNYKTGGVFVEVGAANGVLLSNTYNLEKDFDWNGLCIEPSSSYVLLQQNRSCKTDNRVIWKKKLSDISFIEDILHGGDHLFSGIADNFDKHPVNGIIIEKEADILHNVLEQNEISQHVDYLSIDTEGSELTILETIPFDKWQIDLITIEHNFVEPRRSLMKKLLEENGYIHFNEYDTKWDDWYYHKRIDKIRHINLDIEKTDNMINRQSNSIKNASQDHDYDIDKLIAKIESISSLILNNDSLKNEKLTELATKVNIVESENIENVNKYKNSALINEKLEKANVKLLSKLKKQEKKNEKINKKAKRIRKQLIDVEKKKNKNIQELKSKIKTKSIEFENTKIEFKKNLAEVRTEERNKNYKQFEIEKSKLVQEHDTNYTALHESHKEEVNEIISKYQQKINEQNREAETLKKKLDKTTQDLRVVKDKVLTIIAEKEKTIIANANYISDKNNIISAQEDAIKTNQITINTLIREKEVLRTDLGKVSVDSDKYKTQYNSHKHRLVKLLDSYKELKESYTIESKASHLKLQKLQYKFEESIDIGNGYQESYFKLHKENKEFNRNINYKKKQISYCLDRIYELEKEIKAVKAKSKARHESEVTKLNHQKNETNKNEISNIIENHQREIQLYNEKVQKMQNEHNVIVKSLKDSQNILQNKYTELETTNKINQKRINEENQNYISYYSRLVEELSEDNNRLKKRFESMTNQIQQSNSYIRKILSSYSYRVGNAIFKPLSKITPNKYLPK